MAKRKTAAELRDEKLTYTNTGNMFNNCCAMCGNPEIQMHHINFGSINGGRKTYLGNIIPLCKTHHDLAHARKKHWQPILQKLVDDKLGEMI